MLCYQQRRIRCDSHNRWRLSLYCEIKYRYIKPDIYADEYEFDILQVYVSYYEITKKGKLMTKGKLKYVKWKWRPMLYFYKGF